MGGENIPVFSENRSKKFDFRGIFYTVKQILQPHRVIVRLEGKNMKTEGKSSILGTFLYTVKQLEISITT